MSGLFAEKAGRSLLLAAINREAKKGHSFTFADITFGPPAVVDHLGKTTEVVYTANPSQTKYVGSQKAYYDKIDMEAMFRASGVTDVQVLDSEVIGNTTAGVVTAVNARYGLGFDDNDIVIEPIESPGTVVILRANPMSHGYSGEIVVELVEPTDPLRFMVVPTALGEVILPDQLAPGNDMSNHGKGERDG